MANKLSTIQQRIYDNSVLSTALTLTQLIAASVDADDDTDLDTIALIPQRQEVYLDAITGLCEHAFFITTLVGSGDLQDPDDWRFTKAGTVPTITTPTPVRSGTLPLYIQGVKQTGVLFAT